MEVMIMPSFWTCDGCKENAVKLKRTEPVCRFHVDESHADNPDSRHWEILQAIEKQLDNDEILKAINWLIIMASDLTHEV